jgi:hypothetical protein
VPALRKAQVRPHPRCVLGRTGRCTVIGFATHQFIEPCPVCQRSVDRIESHILLTDAVPTEQKPDANYAGWRHYEVKPCGHLVDQKSVTDSLVLASGTRVPVAVIKLYPHKPCPADL